MDMRGTPIYYIPTKETSTADFYRNYWCSEYELCLNTAARDDLYLDCKQCQYRDNVLENYAVFLSKAP